MHLHEEVEVVVLVGEVVVHLAADVLLEGVLAVCRLKGLNLLLVLLDLLAWSFVGLELGLET